MNMRFTKETEEQLAKLMEEYHASDLDELMDILPDLESDLEYEDEDELPQLPQQEVDLADYFLNYKEPAVHEDEDVTYPFVPYPFNN